jgi:hypothetical protein
METTFKGYKNALGLSNNTFKGALKWFICYFVFYITTIQFFNMINSWTSLICTIFYTAGFTTALQIYNSNVNPPLVTTTLALTDKRRVDYIYLETFSTMGCCTICIVVTFVVISLINYSYIPTTTLGDFVPVVFSIVEPLTFLPLTFVASKKRWIGYAAVIAVIFGMISIALINLADDSHKFVIRTEIDENFSSIPHYKMLFVGICVFCVAIVAVSYFVSIRFANKKYHLK